MGKKRDVADLFTEPKCPDCQNKRESQDAKLKVWMQHRKLFFCLPLSKQAGKKIIVGHHVGKPVCGGKHFQ